MLKKNLRLSTEEVALVVKAGKRLSNQSFSFQFIKNNKKHNRFSVAVSKKVSKTAVLRNKIRRQIYTTLLQYVGATISKNSTGAHIDALISVRKVEWSRADLQDLFKGIF